MAQREVLRTLDLCIRKKRYSLAKKELPNLSNSFHWTCSIGMSFRFHFSCYCSYLESIGTKAKKVRAFDFVKIRSNFKTGFCKVQPETVNTHRSIYCLWLKLIYVSVEHNLEVLDIKYGILSWFRFSYPCKYFVYFALTCVNVKLWNIFYYTQRLRLYHCQICLANCR